MKKITLAALISVALLSCSKSNTADTDWPEITKEAKPWTRWWWMGNDVDSTNLTYNLEELSKAGIGGVEITPIYGVKDREAHYIDYLSPQWMRMLAFTQSEAARLGMGVDMNTGTGWPFGGPEVSIEDAATKAIFQQYELKKGQQLKESITVQDEKQKEFAKLQKLMAYSSKGEVTDITERVSAEGILDWSSSDDDYKLVALFIGKTLQKVKRAAPGGEGYVLNHFDKEAVMRYFGKYDRAFTDNNTPFPNNFFNDSYEVYGADWTPDLLDQFEKRRGYRLQDYFPQLLSDEAADETSVRVVSDYRETVSEILKDNFTQPWADWAHSHGSTTKNQAHGSPANLLDLYAAVDIPECESFGISDFDIPLLRKDSVRKKNDGDPTILKYASSAAHIAGKQYTSSETFTWLTEHFRTSFSQCKPEIDQMFTSGVNHVYFHGTTYSPREAAWPGWKFYASVDMSPTNSIWHDAPAFFGYIARVQSFLQSGKPDNDFLLYFPMHDVWEKQRGNYFTTFAIHGMRERLPEFCDGVEQIMQCGYDLDYISDHFIQTTICENGLLKTQGGAVYKALILPAVKYIPVETLLQIKKLVEQGATVVFAGQYPSDVPGLYRLEERRSMFNGLMGEFPDVDSFDRISENKLGKGIVLTGSDYKELLSKSHVDEETFVSEMGGQLIRRSNDDGHHYFMTMLQNNTVDGWVTLGVKATDVMFFDPVTGHKGQASVRQHNGKTKVYLQLNPGESVILKTFTDRKIKAEKWNYYKPSDNQVVLTGGWVLTFPESEPAVSETFDLTTLGSWTDLNNESLKINMGTGRYTTKFDLRKKDSGEYLLSLGDVRESARVKVNGKDAGTLFAVPYEIKIGNLLQDGENILEIDVTNLPANRIADYDRRGVEWRIFKDINIVSVDYKPAFYGDMQPVLSGLLGPVVIREMNQIEP